jgi:hypothetical protein
MLKKPDPQTRLVADTFQEDWSQGSYRRFAADAARVARRRRITRFLPAAAAAAIVLVLSLSLPPRADRGRWPRTPQVVAVPPSPAAHPAPGYEIVSDAELIAETSGVSLLILPTEREGHRIVLLSGDAPVPKTNS